ncbi:hypothetical protein KTT_05750 [Tengunoibacter tsumagoiensis]|uniref:Solute-binding protein family 3/N-terminal domain-containing protein n=1 Tax=Tengunoibacter tsumagoiensis TaxID=2014871 RepID=A0A401ZVA1_9CHLR|nr:hypothetical protein KTT_05750 [Tengunoibacter tsumagoiensis]
MITVGTYAQYPPQEFIDPKTNQPVGFDIDIMNALALRAHLKLHIVTSSFATLLDSLVNGQLDIVISAVSITPERQQKVHFLPYFHGGESLLVTKGNPDHINSLADLCGHTVGVKEASFEQSDLEVANTDCQNAGKPGIVITSVPKQHDVLQLILSNHVSATYQDAPITDYAIKQNSAKVERAGILVDDNLEGIALRKEANDLYYTLQHALEQMKADGSYHALIKKWGLTSGDILANP